MGIMLKKMMAGAAIAIGLYTAAGCATVQNTAPHPDNAGPALDIQAIPISLEQVVDMLPDEMQTASAASEPSHLNLDGSYTLSKTDKSISQVSWNTGFPEDMIKRQNPDISKKIIENLRSGSDVTITVPDHLFYTGKLSAVEFPPIPDMQDTQIMKIFSPKGIKNKNDLYDKLLLPTIEKTMENIAKNGLEPAIRKALEYAPDLSYEEMVAVIAVESKGVPGLLSPKRARGIVQMLPGTASGWMKKNNAYKVGNDPRYNPLVPFGSDAVSILNDPEKNIYLATFMLQEEKSYFLRGHGGMLYGSEIDRLTHASYNSGRGNVNKARGIPNITETMQYVLLVEEMARIMKQSPRSGLAFVEDGSATRYR